jgi:hypothetical protein
VIRPDYRATASESQILQAVMRVVKMHSAVAFAWRANTGGTKFGNQHVRFGFPGQSDILGCLKGGRFLALEVKRPGAQTTPEQTAFLEAVRRAGGVGAVVRSAEETLQILDAQLRAAA